MITEQAKIDQFYDMLVKKNSNYEGVFYVGVKTTGILCRPTCPAKKPNKENCEFFETAQEALLASYRPCKRCQPLSNPSKLSKEVKLLVEAIEANPERKWSDKDFDELAISANTARRQFKKQFGMTFIEYARARRLGFAFDHIRNGAPIIEAQLEGGYDSGNGFRDAFTRTMGIIPKKATSLNKFASKWIETPLGSMIAIANDDALILLEFVDRRGLETEIEVLRKKWHAAVIPGESPIFEQLMLELDAYFSGNLQVFQTPIAYLGSPFQQTVWQALQKIPIGSTISYAQLASQIGNPKAFRAVARANGANQLSILVPCHRVIGSNGALSGYGGGIARKEWLLTHEKKIGATNQL
ncbi:bifunctional transcriptional activator/DNA repair enzyme AdaA [Listeria newyorkensis]|uniref:Bifunctional transcriptional activator/DNA repair protein Ada n=1 Tax=Listeria newyorkensis TaxID=1497681 RepID=A0A841YU84_9LIST|nr:trifunctional transcriptional activator/DNA repair protein Ada/methylated-DNA--[protein]-cysteine S-methyltransferase [Listeria newyorkensis]MBC1456845.1 bifunctional transcriptional activator/DNA repair protein Ada [Listeria newyorkensis]